MYAIAASAKGKTERQTVRN